MITEGFPLLGHMMGKIVGVMRYRCNMQITKHVSVLQALDEALDE